MLEGKRLDGTQGTLFLSISKRNSQAANENSNLRTKNNSRERQSLENGRSSLGEPIEDQHFSDDSNGSEDAFYASHVAHLRAKTVDP